MAAITAYVRRLRGRRQMERPGIVRDASGRKRGRLFVYDDYLRLLNEGVEPNP